MTSILDRPLTRRADTVSLSAFAFLFSELVQYSRTRAETVSELENRLAELGARIGIRVLALVSLREGKGKRETSITGILEFIRTNVWKTLFSRPADLLEKDIDEASIYYLSDEALLVNKFVSVPREMGDFNCGSFVGGMIASILTEAGFPATVSTHATAKGTTFRIDIFIK